MIVRHVETIFCDDIRYEVGGKLSLIGVYSGGLLVNKFPVILPKLCVLIKIVTPAEEPLSALKVRILKNDETLQEVDVDDLKNATEPLATSPDEESQQRCHTAQFNLTFSPIHFDSPCTLRVLVRTRDEELRGLALKVGLAPPSEGSVPIQPSE